jgi:hypothetical protein
VTLRADTLCGAVDRLADHGPITADHEEAAAFGDAGVNRVVAGYKRRGRKGNRDGGDRADPAWADRVER